MYEDKVDAYVLRFYRPWEHTLSSLTVCLASATFLETINAPRRYAYDDEEVRAFVTRIFHGESSQLIRVNPQHLDAAKRWIKECGFTLEWDKPETSRVINGEALYRWSKEMMVQAGYKFPDSTWSDD